MNSATPSSGPSGHLLPQGEKENSEPLPSPLAGEGGSRRLTDEGVPRQRKHLPALPPPVPTIESFAQLQSKRLRKDMTDVERILWSNLRSRKFEHLKFRRQVPLGRYIADFVCFEHKLIVELDGSQHEESAHDKTRDAWLKSQGFRVLRFWNVDILQALDGSLRAILDGTTPSSGATRHLLPQGEKGNYRKPIPSPLAAEGGSRRLTDEGVQKEKLTLFDTTLRDGQQTPGIDFSLDDKLVVIDLLDKLGLDYIEGGYAGGNPTDIALFAEPRKTKATFTAFGMTKRAGRSVSNDAGLQTLLQAKTAATCFVAKTWDYHVRVALGCTNEENLESIRDSIAAAKTAGKEVIVDCEHFFDGYKANPTYATQCAKTAYDAGARWVVLCDTNGGTLPHEVSTIVRTMTKTVPGSHLGIHAHNDTEHAVANSFAAVDAGARHIQGTLNGIGERCGNANLVSIMGTLVTKAPYKDEFETGVNITELTAVSRAFDELLNRAPNAQAPYVGKSAFATKAGIHASALAKEPETYEHVPPETVGNRRRILISDQAGKSNLIAELNRIGLTVDKNDTRLDALLRDVKERESQGYTYDGADASFELLARRAIETVPHYFDVLSFRTSVEQRNGEMLSEAVVKVKVDGETMINAGEGNGPVNALDVALRKDLGKYQKYIDDMELVDFKVRILNGGTGATTRVLIESRDKSGNRWFTVGVSPNIVEASFQALLDSIVYKLVKSGLSQV